jgi:integrase/recombinase XerD
MSNPYSLIYQSERFLQELTAAGRAATTLRQHRRGLRYFKEYLFDHKHPDDIRTIQRLHINRYVVHCMSRQKYSMDSKVRWLSCIKTFFGWLAAQDLILSDPTAKLDLPKTARVRLPPHLSRGETMRLLAAADPSTARGLRDRALLETLYSTGMRNAECCALALSDIDFAAGTVRILAGKGQKDRVIPIGRIALHFIDRYVKEVRGPGAAGPLFRWLSEPRGFSHHQLYMLLNHYRKKAGIKRLYPHLLRHTFAVHMMEAGADIRFIQEMLGHESINSTQIYTQMAPVELKRAHQSCHPGEHRKERLLVDINPRVVVNSNPGWIHH